MSVNASCWLFLVYFCDTLVGSEFEEGSLGFVYFAESDGSIVL